MYDDEKNELFRKKIILLTHICLYYMNFSMCMPGIHTFLHWNIEKMCIPYGLLSNDVHPQNWMFLIVYILEND